MKRWPINKAYFWETIPFFRILLPFVVGISIFSFTETFISEHITALHLTSAITLGVYLYSHFAKKLATINFYSTQLLLVLSAFLLCYYNNIKNDQHWFGHTLQEQHTYIAKVMSKPVEKNRTIKLEVSVLGYVDRSNLKHTLGKAFVYIYKYDAPVYKEGDILLLPNKWQTIENSGNPFEFDYKTYTARQNIYYQQFLPSSEIVIYKYSQTHKLPLVRQIHYWCLYQLEYYVQDIATLGILKAMLLGDKNELDNDIQQAYANTGIIHIIAISGAHIAIFFVAVGFLLSFIRHRKYYWVRYIAALPFIWLYVLVAGAPPSAIRAAVMFTILGIGFALKKENHGINQLLVAAFILLCFNPMWLFTVGFQLSFLAVLSIFIFYKPLNHIIQSKYKLIRLLWSSISVSIAAEILVAPLVIYYFHLFPVQFVVANLIAFLFMGFILLSGMSIILFSSIPVIAVIISHISILLTRWLNSIIYKLQHLNTERFTTLQVSELQLVLIYLFITSLGVFLLKKKKAALFIAIASCVVLCGYSIYNTWQITHQRKVIVYNIRGGHQIDLIKGTRCTTLSYSDNISESTIEYVLKPVRINMRISQVDTNDSNLIKINDKTLLIIDNDFPQIKQHVDYIILNTSNPRVDINHIYTTYSPEKLIITGSISKAKVKHMLKTCDELRLSYHSTNEDGAFIIGD